MVFTTVCLWGRPEWALKRKHAKGDRGRCVGERIQRPGRRGRVWGRCASQVVHTSFSPPACRWSPVVSAPLEAEAAEFVLVFVQSDQVFNSLLPQLLAASDFSSPALITPLICWRATLRGIILAG